MDVAKYVDAAQTVFDGIAIGILEKIGKVSLIDNPNYAPENDPEIIAAVERWKKYPALICPNTVKAPTRYI